MKTIIQIDFAQPLFLSYLGFIVTELPTGKLIGSETQLDYEYDVDVDSFDLTDVEELDLTSEN